MKKHLSILLLFLSITFSFAQNIPAKIYPKYDIANKNPLQSLLGANEVFTAGDFPVTVISAQGSNGIYSGTGYIVVPYLADTKIKVSFNNIKLNTDKKLIEGTIETTYDPTEKNVISLGDIFNDLGNLFDGIVKIIDDAIGNGGMSPKDFDDLSNNLGTYTGQSGSAVSNLYDQGLVSTELKDKIQAEKDKIDNLLKNLNCTKDDKGKGDNENNFNNEDDCTEKLKELKTLLQNYQNFVNEALENRCIWNIAPNESLKGKTFYFQTSEKNNDGEGKKMYKLKAGDYSISFNKNGAVYTFKSNNKIYRPFSDNSYYYSKTSEDKYAFETGNSSTLVEVKVDKDNANAISINNTQITAQQDCTDAKEKGNGLSENLVFSTVVKGMYSVSVEKNSKGELVSTFQLLGKGNSKIPDSQKTGIEQEVQNAIDDVLKDLKNPDELSKIQTNDSGFYVKQMTGKEWITTLSDLGTNVWENAALPENYWNEDKGSTTNNVRMPALFTGVSDGVIGEVTEYPQLIKLGYDVATKEQIRKGLWTSIQNISIESIKNASINFYEEKKVNYTSDKTFVVNHTLGKDGVQLASMFFGAGGIKKAVNNLEDGVEKAGKEILTEVDDAVVKQLSGADNLAKKLTKEAIDNGDFDKEIVEGLTNEANDIAIKKGRKLSWEEVKALFKRGNDFNKKGRLLYKDRFCEIHLGNGKRLDTYIPGEKIISRKATDIDNITEQTWRNYCNELVSKYKVGTPVKSMKLPNEAPLNGKYYLEIPSTNNSAQKIQQFKNIAKEYGTENGGIEVIFLNE